MCHFQISSFQTFSQQGAKDSPYDLALHKKDFKYVFVGGERKKERDRKRERMNVGKVGGRGFGFSACCCWSYRRQLLPRISAENPGEPSLGPPEEQFVLLFADSSVWLFLFLPFFFLFFPSPSLLFFCFLHVIYM